MDTVTLKEQCADEQRHRAVWVTGLKMVSAAGTTTVDSASTRWQRPGLPFSDPPPAGVGQMYGESCSKSNKKWYLQCLQIQEITWLVTVASGHCMSMDNSSCPFGGRALASVSDSLSGRCSHRVKRSPVSPSRSASIPRYRSCSQRGARRPGLGLSSIIARCSVSTRISSWESVLCGRTEHRVNT